VTVSPARARRFCCTTIPNDRKIYGLVGANCINVDANYLNEEIRNNPQYLDALINAICNTDKVLDQITLSKDEYENASAGKRHFRDFTAIAGQAITHAMPRSSALDPRPVLWLTLLEALVVNPAAARREDCGKLVSA